MKNIPTKMIYIQLCAAGTVYTYRRRKAVRNDGFKSLEHRFSQGHTSLQNNKFAATTGNSIDHTRN